jgi:F-box protein 20
LDLPKVDIHKRRELFEKEQKEEVVNTSTAASKLGTEIVSIKDRISSLRNNLATSTVSAAPPKKVELPTTTKLKDRLSSLQQVTSPVDEPKKNPLDTQFKNVQEVKNEFEMKAKADDNESLGSTDREDSGIQTTDVSCAVSQADEHIEHIEEFQEKLESLNLESSKDEPEPEPVDDESSVSCSDDDQTHSVLVLNIDEATNKATKAPNDAILEFIQSNLIDEHQQMMDNNYVYECIINRSEHQLEKSNSIDTALSLCSSSDGQSLMDDADDKMHR